MIFSEMTNAQLKEACEDFGLEVEAKNPAKPNKTELLATLDAFKATQDATHADRNAEKAEEAASVDDSEPKLKDGSKRKPQSKSVLMKLDLLMKERVIIHDQQDQQTKDELMSVSWGNRRIGGQTDMVDVGSGNPQYVRRGALQNLRDAGTYVQTPKEGGGVQTERRNRFIIVNVEGWDANELEEHKNKHKLRNAKYA